MPPSIENAESAKSTWICALRRPPLSCRTSPPQGGRLAVLEDFANLERWRLAKANRPFNLPPCGGDVRQDREGRDGAQTMQESPPVAPHPPIAFSHSSTHALRLAA